MLSLSNLDAFYGDAQVLWNISIEVDKGEIVSILGANGAGKSTTLKIISGILRPMNGSVRLGNNHINRVDPSNIVSIESPTFTWNL